MKISEAYLLMVVATITFCVILWASCLLIAAVFFFNSEPAKPIEEQRESIDWNISEGDRSSRWTEVRNNFVKKHPVCEACGTSAALNVHHVEPFHVRPELELDESNLITLCREHHFRIGHDPDGPWRPKKPSWLASNPMVRFHAEQFKEGRRY